MKTLTKGRTMMRNIKISIYTNGVLHLIPLSSLWCLTHEYFSPQGISVNKKQIHKTSNVPCVREKKTL